MVDIDEADVAVLNQNLIKSKELFASISKSLNKISSKSTNASNKIKPILREVNTLTKDSQEIDRGIGLLKGVSEYAERTNNYETILNNSVDIIGLKKYLDTMGKLQLLLKEMKKEIKGFHGILLNFENLIDKSEFKLVGHYKKLVENGKFNDILILTKYFDNKNPQINKILVDSRSLKLMEKMSQVEKNHNFKPKNLGPRSPPYERGSNGITAYCQELISLISKEYELLQKLDNVKILGSIINHQMDSFNSLIESNYIAFFTESNILMNDLLVLEIVELLEHFKLQFSEYDDINNYKVGLSITKLYNVFRQLFKEYLKFIEARIHSAEKITELNSTEIVVELITKIRKASDYPDGLNLLISNYGIGEWLNIKLLKFITVYTSVIKNDIDEPQLLSNFMSDLIDCIMINLEICLKEYKKSTQGFFLIKNIILIETIVNRSQNLYNILGNIGIDRLNKLKNRFLKLFLDDWNYASYIIIRDMTQLTTLNATHQSNELSNKEKDQIKKLFETFNESFEEALRNYEKFNILDPNLKQYLISEIKKLIINAYFKLYDKYGNSGFTKNKSKYVKYNKLEFETYLDKRLN